MSKFVVTGKQLFDGYRLVNDFYFIVENDKIVEVGSLSDKTFEAQTILDMGDKFVMPGLIDSHVHLCLDPYNGKKLDINPLELTLTIQENMKTLLHQGITYVRDVGAPKHVMQMVKKLKAEGRLAGPDMKVSGQAICATGGHGWQMSKESNSVDDMRKMVRENVKENVDLIKLMVTGGINTPGDELAPLELTSEEIQVAIEEAHRRGKKVAVHTHGRTGIELSVKHGVDSIEHGLFMDDELSDIALEKGIYLVPTLSAPYFATVMGLKKDPTSKSFLKSKEVMELHNQNTLKAYEKGVKIAMGSDSGTPFNSFDSVLQELVLLSDIGIPNEAILKMATSSAADLLDVETTHGTIEAGKKATFVVFDQNPMEDMENIHTLDMVYQDGVKVK